MSFLVTFETYRGMMNLCTKQGFVSRIRFIMIEIIRRNWRNWRYQWIMKAGFVVRFVIRLASSKNTRNWQFHLTVGFNIQRHHAEFMETEEPLSQDIELDVTEVENIVTDGVDSKITGLRIVGKVLLLAACMVLLYRNNLQSINILLLILINNF